MIAIPYWLIIASAFMFALFMGVIVLGSGDRAKGEHASPDLAISPEGDLVTIRKLPSGTSITISAGLADHWDGSDGVSVRECPTEVTSAAERDLYQEYLSPKTSAVRKYEIIEILYNQGYTLPYQSGLFEQWKAEMKSMSGTAPADQKK